MKHHQILKPTVLAVAVVLTTLFIFPNDCISGEITPPVPPQIGNQRNPEVTLEQAVQAIKRNYDALHAVYVTYDWNSAVADGSQRPGEALPLVRREFAWSGVKRYTKTGQPTADGELVAFETASNGDVVTSYTPGGNGFIQAVDGISDTLGVDAYLSALGIPLSEEQLASTGRTDTLMPFCLEIPELEWGIADQLELVDGVPCVVLIAASTGQKLWVDPNAKFAVRRRLHFFQKENRGGPAEYQRFVESFHDFQYHHGFPFPQRITLVSRDSAPSGGPDAMHPWDARAELALVSIRVSQDVNPSIFKISFPYEAVVHDLVRGTIYRAGTDGEELPLILELSQAELGSQSSKVWGRMLLAVNVVLLTYVAFMVFRRNNNRAV